MNEFAKLHSILEKFADVQFEQMKGSLRSTVICQMFGPIGTALRFNDPNLTLDTLQQFLDKLLLQRADINQLKCRKAFVYNDLISHDVLYDPWFTELHNPFFTLKPGNSQAGPFEFMLCFLFNNVDYIQQADRGGDVLVDRKYRVEIKSHNSKKTIDHQKMEYYSNGGCNVLLIVKPATKTYPPILAGLDFDTTPQWDDVCALTKISSKETKLYLLANHEEIVKSRGIWKDAYLTPLAA